MLLTAKMMIMMMIMVMMMMMIMMMNDGDDYIPRHHAVERCDDGDSDNGNSGDPNTCCNSGWVDS